MVEQRLRQALLLLAGVTFLVTPLELWLTEHTDKWQQFIPFGLCGLGFVAVLGVLRLARRETLYFLRGVALLLVMGSLLGMYYHLAGNFAFELEIRPNATHRDVLMDALKGAAPLLAPGLLSLAAALAGLATYAHPALKAPQ